VSSLHSLLMPLCALETHLWRLILESAIYGSVKISDLLRPQESLHHELSKAAFAICNESNPRAGMNSRHVRAIPWPAGRWRARRRIDTG